MVSELSPAQTFVCGNLHQVQLLPHASDHHWQLCSRTGKGRWKIDPHQWQLPARNFNHQGSGHTVTYRGRCERLIGETKRSKICKTRSIARCEEQHAIKLICTFYDRDIIFRDAHCHADKGQPVKCSLQDYILRDKSALWTWSHKHWAVIRRKNDDNQ